MRILMKTCAFPGCHNRFPKHHVDEMCGKRHVAVIGNRGPSREFITLAMERGLVSPKVILVTAPSYGHRLVKEATAVVVLVTNNGTDESARYVLGISRNTNKVLIVAPEGAALSPELAGHSGLKFAATNEEALERLILHLDASWGIPEAATNINA